MQENWQTILLRPRTKTSSSSSLPKTFLDLEKVSCLIVDGKWVLAEAALLSALDCDDKERLSLLACLDLRLRNFSRLNCLIPFLVEQYSQDSFVRSLWVHWCLIKGDDLSLNNLDGEFWRDEETCLHLALMHGECLLRQKAFGECQVLLDTLLVDSNIERDLLQAKLLSKQRNYLNAIELLKSWQRRALAHPDFWRTLLQCHFDLREGNQLASLIDLGLEQVPRSEELLDLFAWACLLNRKPALARRSLLLQRLLGWNLFSPTPVAQLCHSQELVGSIDYLLYLHHAIDSEPAKYLDVHGSLLLHLTSIEHQSVQAKALQYMEILQAHPDYSKHLSSNISASTSHPKGDSLKVAWITGDCRYHPVSRFLLGLLNAYSGHFSHKHYLVSTRPFDDEIPEMFKAINGLEVLDYSQSYAHLKTQAIRDLKADIAIDLSGWTDGNVATAFLSRVAPVQINYLGYFGSTGIPAMDWWLGDKNLFPEQVHQWHSEKLFRLNRCFIAWQPHPELPEAKAEVQTPPSGPVRFGCFNHLRKLSDLTLETWASILSSIPDSRLLVKAAGFEDDMAISLLSRRLKRAGFDLERIDFLSFSLSALEHLSQYRYIDIALDPFPNGGCTTTVEALWMGVPVITMSGKSYVSRMSTAVLKGAELDQLVAQDITAYISLAKTYASNVNSLRADREKWRFKLKSSSLGNARDLMSSLENAFQVMNV